MSSSINNDDDSASLVTDTSSYSNLTSATNSRMYHGGGGDVIGDSQQQNPLTANSLMSRRTQRTNTTSANEDGDNSVASSWTFADSAGSGILQGYGAYNDTHQPNTTQVDEAAAQKKRNKRTWDGVFLPVSVSVFGVVLFIRLPWIVGEAGLLMALLAIFLCYLASGLTTVSMAAISTNGYVGDGGPYMMISRCLGPQVGIVVGVTFVMANAVSSAMYLIGSAEIMAKIIPWSNLEVWRNEDKYLVTLILSSMMLMALLVIAFLSIEKPFRICCMVLTMISIVDIIVAMTSEKPDESYGFTGPSRQSWSDNIKPSYSGDGTNFQTIISVLFPGVTGVMSGVCVSGELVHTAKAIPKGIGYAWGSSLVIYVTITFIIAASFQRSFLQDNFGILNHVGHPWLFYPGEAVACFAAVLAMLGGSIRVLQAMAKDDLMRSALFRIIGSSSLKNATLFYGMIVQLILFAGDTYQPVSLIAAQIYCCNFLALNLSTFVSSVSGVVSFRPIYRFFNKTTALLGALVNLVLMFYMSPIAALCFLTFVLVLVVAVDFHVDTSNIPWGDASQPIVFHFVRKWLLRLDERKEHIRHWRPSIVMINTDPLCSLNLIHLANNLKKGGLFELAYVLKGDFESTSVSCFRWKGWAMDFIGASAVKAFAVVTFGQTLRAGVQSILRTCGLGGMKANTVIISLDEFLQRDSFVDIYKNYNLIKEEQLLEEREYFRRRNAAAGANAKWSIGGGNGGGHTNGGAAAAEYDHDGDGINNQHHPMAIPSYFQFGKKSKDKNNGTGNGGATGGGGRNDETGPRHFGAAPPVTIAAAPADSDSKTSFHSNNTTAGKKSVASTKNSSKARKSKGMDAVRMGANCEDLSDTDDPNDHYHMLGRTAHLENNNNNDYYSQQQQQKQRLTTRASCLGEMIDQRRSMAPVINEKIRDALSRTSVVMPRGVMDTIGHVHRPPNMLANDSLEYGRGGGGGGGGGSPTNLYNNSNRDDEDDVDNYDEYDRLQQQKGGGGGGGGWASTVRGLFGGGGKNNKNKKSVNFSSTEDDRRSVYSNRTGADSVANFGGFSTAARFGGGPSGTTNANFSSYRTRREGFFGGGNGGDNNSPARSNSNNGKKKGGGKKSGGGGGLGLVNFTNNATTKHRDDEEHQIEKMVMHRKAALEINEKTAETGRSAVDLAPFEDIQEFCDVCADVNHVHMNLIIARNIDKLDKKAIERSKEKVFIDLWLPDEEDAVVFLMGYSLSRTSVWQKHAVLRIVSVVSFNDEIEAQNATMRSILKTHRIDAITHTVSLEMETYRRGIDDPAVVHELLLDEATRFELLNAIMKAETCYNTAIILCRVDPYQRPRKGGGAAAAHHIGLDDRRDGGGLVVDGHEEEVNTTGSSSSSSSDDDDDGGDQDITQIINKRMRKSNPSFVNNNSNNNATSSSSASPNSPVIVIGDDNNGSPIITSDIQQNNGGGGSSAAIPILHTTRSQSTLNSTANLRQQQQQQQQHSATSSKNNFALLHNPAVSAAAAAAGMSEGDQAEMMAYLRRERHSFQSESGVGGLTRKISALGSTFNGNGTTLLGGTANPRMSHLNASSYNNNNNNASNASFQSPTTRQTSTVSMTAPHSGFTASANSNNANANAFEALLKAKQLTTAADDDEDAGAEAAVPPPREEEEEDVTHHTTAESSSSGKKKSPAVSSPQCDGGNANAVEGDEAREEARLKQKKKAAEAAEAAIEAAFAEEVAKEWFASIVALSADLPPMLMIAGGPMKGKTSDW